MRRTDRKLTPEQSALAAGAVPLAWYCARRIIRGPRYVGRLDLLEEARDAAVDALLDAARDFDPGRDKPFSAIATRYCCNAVYCRIRYWSRACRSAGTVAVSLDQLAEVDQVAEDLDAEDLDAGSVAALLAYAGRYADVLRWRYVEDLGHAAIGRRLGISRQAASSKIRRGLALVRAQLEALGHAGIAA